MRRVVSACLGLFVLAVAAEPTVAADLPVRAPVKAPIAAPAPILSWTGFYIGGHVGAAWSRGDASTDFDPAVIAGIRPTRSLRDTSIAGGAQIGYNWQFVPSWVAGIEVDFSWTDNSATGTAPNLFLNGAPAFGGHSWTRDVNWLASARGRIGYLVAPAVLVYFTGGVAWADIDYRARFTEDAGTSWTTTFGKIKTGYVLGGGAEWLLAGNWMLRGEYLYYRFGGASIVSLNNPIFTTIPVTFRWDDTEVHVARAALSYKFGPR